MVGIAFRSSRRYLRLVVHYGLLGNGVMSCDAIHMKIIMRLGMHYLYEAKIKQQILH